MSVERALISVSDKTGLVKFAKKLEKAGVEILSTGGTAKELKKNGVKVVDVADFTGAPEMMDGRVKTLHPKVHGGILALRDNKKHMEEAKREGVKMIDMVVVNLYPFEKIVARGGDETEVIENIDVGGPSMVRSAAKNFKHVVVVTDPEDYEWVSEDIVNTGEVDLEKRKKLARKAFSLTHRYDYAIEKYFRELVGDSELMELHYEKVGSLRYGENPQQKAAFFRNPKNTDSNITNSVVLHGRQLSFNNIVDGDSALELVKEFKMPAAVFIKHNNPCGVACSGKLEDAFIQAYQVDPMSAFGCIIAVNGEVNEKIVDHMRGEKMFVELIIAPSYSKGALERLKTRENLRILEVGKLKLDKLKTDIKKVAGGVLIQTKDTYELKKSDLKVVTKKKPSDEEISAMLFATKVCKHVMSNSVVMAKKNNGGYVTVGIGAGQMSRVDSVCIACMKGGDGVKGSVMASDAFFPFPDAMEKAAESGVIGFIQPGGSMRDDEIIKRADELGVSMVFSGRRYFRH
ncbi:MAG: bifunctional phosphoribosylaminoimidazolecarboxamide formyltransferase/IMP cyclohydrolase [Candidatus Peregrinibacteria bacterium]